jgi:hypothetical protein
MFLQEAQAISLYNDALKYKMIGEDEEAEHKFSQVLYLPYLNNVRKKLRLYTY